MKRCPICGLNRARLSWSMCDPCGISYDRTAHRDGAVIEAMIWAANRARRFHRRTKRTRVT